MRTRTISPRRRPRAGITLTEILISIFIMGIGMLSLATLFPLGLQRLRDAARSSRSAMLIESATSEISSRDLLYKPSFRVNGYPFDPFTQDPSGAGDLPTITTGIDRVSQSAAYTGLRGGAGVPVCYDPLWWYQVFMATGAQPTLTAGSEFRFGSGIGSLRNDPSGGTPSAHGLQRITNFPLVAALGGPIDPASLFCSPDDMVNQTDGARYSVLQTDGTVRDGTGVASPLVPDLSNRSRMYDYAYTWIFTGKQSDTANGTMFDGDLVIFHNRPFAVEQRNGVNVAAGERVVEAIWGYSSVPNALGHGNNSRTVLLRWPATEPDPDVRVGGYLADVTYERNNAAEISRFYTAINANPASAGVYPAQRCLWYRVIKKTDAAADHEMAGYREMTVTLGDDLRARTALSASGSAVHVNAALVSPYVINVVPRVFYTR